MTTSSKSPLDRTIRDKLATCEDLDMQLEEIEDRTRRAQSAKEDLENTLKDLKAAAHVLAEASTLSLFETDLATYIYEHREAMDYRTERMFEQIFRLVQLAPSTFA